MSILLQERLIMIFSSSYQLFIKSINTTGKTHHRRNTVNKLNSSCLCPSIMTLRSSRADKLNLWAQFIKAKQCNTNTKEQRNLIPHSLLKSQYSVPPQIEHPSHTHSTQGLGPIIEGGQRVLIGFPEVLENQSKIVSSKHGKSAAILT